jgi:hypothetical protein
MQSDVRSERRNLEMCDFNLLRLALLARRRYLQILLVVVGALQLAACSKTVQWEEEVPLNTGEVIWVKRTDTFIRRSEPGNPLQMGWWPNHS